ncbi:MAG TPA: type II toxin-antitoxin system PemK/MazF family toxin [Tepidisphaeraceae bacterium]|nr:type II toxin-antitoxin system PemK/MazF family toxin [Tepidisphaeraceae bacterium]
MSSRTYHPERGDLIELNFQPAAGREIDKRRPAIVLSPRQYNRKSGLCVAIPVSTDLTPGPLWIKMPDGYLSKPSLILCDYIKSFDYRERSATFIKRISNELVEQIVGNLLDIIDPIQ